MERSSQYQSCVKLTDRPVITGMVRRLIQAVFQAPLPGMAIHIMGIVQPPGIGIPPPMLRTPWRVNAAASTKMAVAEARANQAPPCNEEFAGVEVK